MEKESSPGWQLNIDDLLVNTLEPCTGVTSVNRTSPSAELAISAEEMAQQQLVSTKKKKQ